MIIYTIGDIKIIIKKEEAMVNKGNTPNLVLLTSKQFIYCRNMLKQLAFIIYQIDYLC